MSWGALMSTRVSWIRCTLEYPRHAFQPEELLTFIEMRPFTASWRDLGLSDQDLMALQIMIMLRPRGFPVVPGSGGLRKLRFAPAAWSQGKRGAIRVCYVHFADYGVVLLVLAYGKSEKDNLSAAEKKAIRQLIQRQEVVFSQRVVR